MKKFRQFLLEDRADAEEHGYRVAEDTDKRCDPGCGAWKAPSYCNMFEFNCDPKYVCDEWYPSSGVMGEEICEADWEVMDYGDKDPKYGHAPTSHVVKRKDDNGHIVWEVYNHAGKIVKVFYSKKSAEDYSQKFHDALMKNKIKANEDVNENQV